MSVAGVKRKHSAKQRPKKRPKKEDVQHQVVGESDLAWKEVTLPDRLEDAEGFFGLEEIDGVDIIREEGKPGIQFRVRYAALRVKEQTTD